GTLCLSHHAPTAATVTTPPASPAAIQFSFELRFWNVFVPTCSPVAGRSPLRNVGSVPVFIFSRTKSAFISVAFLYRWLRSFSIAFSMMASSSAGTAGLIDRGDAGFELTGRHLPPQTPLCSGRSPVRGTTPAHLSRFAPLTLFPVRGFPSHSAHDTEPSDRTS